MTDRNPRLDPDNTLPVLPGWVSITEAGERLGVTRQYAYRMAQDRKFKTLTRIGTAHQFVVQIEEIDQMLEQRREAEHEKDEEQWHQ